MNIRKDDTVLVISGKYRGKRGRVVRAMPSLNRVVVQGVNLRKRHRRPSKDLPQGGIVEAEGPIDRSNVLLVCPKCSKPTRIGSGKADDGKKVRVCHKCGEAIDK
ncbi:MAG: 50S ribosomal protein L24 [Bacillota bacterium]|jgi:large subunit ribosomal protein L24